jgi:peptide/nickel transport system substrate-binding protein
MTRNARRPMRSGWILAVAMVLTACGAPGAATPTATGGAAGTPQGSITLALNAEPETLSSWQSVDTTGYPILRNVQEALLNRDAVTNEFVPELATSWERTDPKTWRFELRHGVKFHDGSPFDAEAAAFALNYLWSKKNALLVRVYIGPEFVVNVVDDDTIDVVSETPDPIMPARLYFSTIPSMKQLKEDPTSYDSVPIGTGPYRFVEWKRGESIKLTASQDWWGRTAADAHGKVTIKDVTFVYRAEQEVRAAMVSSGEADFARWTSKEQCEDAPQCIRGPGIETTILRLDVPSVVMRDIRVRQAIAMAVDRDSIMNKILGGGTLASQIVGPSALGFDPSLKPYPYDPERAKALIADAKADGVPVDSPLTMMMNVDSPLKPPEVSEFVTQALKAVGLNVKTQLLETARFEDLFDDYPVSPTRGMLLLDSHGNEMMDVSQTASGYYKCGAYSTYCDKDLEALVNKAEPLVGEARESAFQEVERYVYDHYYIIPIGQPLLFYALSDRLNWKTRLDGFILLKEMTLK